VLLSRRDVVRAFFPGPPFSGSVDHSYGTARWSAREMTRSILRGQRSAVAVHAGGVLCVTAKTGHRRSKWVRLGNACAGRPARSRWCKSTTMKE